MRPGKASANLKTKLRRSVVRYASLQQMAKGRKNHTNESYF